MRFYTSQHAHYCGVDLHARTMYLCVLDSAGEVRLHRNLPTRPDAFLQAIEPFREGLVVGVECLFCWYWLADLCAAETIPFVLGHAHYMKAAHGGKSKNDRIDSHKIAALLRGGTFPMAYVYPRQMRATRDLLRRRLYFVRKRAELFSHIQNTNTQYNLQPIGRRIDEPANRPGLIEHFADDTSVQVSITADLVTIETLDYAIDELELFLVQAAREHDPARFQLLRRVFGASGFFCTGRNPRQDRGSRQPSCCSEPSPTRRLTDFCVLDNRGPHRWLGDVRLGDAFPALALPLEVRTDPMSRGSPPTTTSRS
jgi:hypothetical protein